MSEGTKSDRWEPPSCQKMARFYDERDQLKAEVKRLEQGAECVTLMMNAIRDAILGRSDTTADDMRWPEMPDAIKRLRDALDDAILQLSESLDADNTYGAPTSCTEIFAEELVERFRAALNPPEPQPPDRTPPDRPTSPRPKRRDEDAAD